MMLFAFFVVAAAAAPAWPSAEAAPIDRKVFVTVVDGNGAPVTDLTSADLVVKEGGKEREIVTAEPASQRMRIALAVEERMVADSAVRMALFEFMKRLADRAEFALITIGLRNTTVVDYTTNLSALVQGINSFTLNPARESSVAEGVLELSSKFVDSKPERPVIVVVSLSGGQAGVEARTVLDKLRQSGAMMYAATLVGGEASGPLGSMGEQSGREQVLGDGPKQSGGRRVGVNATGAMPAAMLQIANELLAQYAVTYALPDGVKPDRRFSISTKRRGLTLRAPSSIPDK
jgi:hypothetical protein